MFLTDINILFKGYWGSKGSKDNECLKYQYFGFSSLVNITCKCKLLISFYALYEMKEWVEVVDNMFSKFWMSSKGHWKNCKSGCKMEYIALMLSHRNIKNKMFDMIW